MLHPRSLDLLATTALGLLLAATPALAQSTAVVTGDAANDGSFGLRLTLSSTCNDTGFLELADQTVSTAQDFAACSELGAERFTVEAGGDADFTAGSKIALGNDFSVANGGAFSATLDPSKESDAWVRDDTPNAEPRYRARGYVDLDGMTLSTSEGLLHFIGSDANGVAVFRVGLVHNQALGERRVYIEARNDDGSWATTRGTSEAVFPAGYNAFEIDWQQASSAGADDGALDLWIAGVAQVGLSGLDNDSSSVDTVHWGAIGLSSANDGVMDLDDFRSQRSGLIGLLP